jgi:YidC/Oxa1 family membrane protein insertase
LEKRFPLALLLCFLAVMLWARLFPPPEVQGPDGAGAPVETQPSEAPPSSGAADPAEPASVGESVDAPGANQVRTSAEAPSAAPAAPSSSQAPSVGAPLAAEGEQQIEQRYGSAGSIGRFLARFSNRGGRLVELKTGDYFTTSGLSPAERDDPRHWVTLLDSATDVYGSTGSLLVDAGLGARDLFPAPLDGVLWQASELFDEAGAPRGVEFRYGPGNGYTLVKRFEALPGGYDFALTLRLEAAAGLQQPLAPKARQLVLRPAGVAAVEYEDSFYQQPNALALGRGRNGEFDLETKPHGSGTEVGNFDVPAPVVLAGVHVKYFAVLLRGADSISEQRTRTASFRRLTDLSEPAGSPFREQVVTDVNLDLELPAPGQASELAFRLYAGPKDHRHFLAASPLHRRVLDSDLSTFSGIGSFLTDVLLLLERGVKNYGVAIILLTLLVRLALFPLNRRAQTAMARYQTKMKRLQPALDAIKKKHEDDPQKLRQEQAVLMQKEGAFPPLGGCLPVFLQLPIFFGLFSALRTNFELRQAPFVSWISDLSRPDRLFELGDGLPFGLTHFNLLPVLMVILWIWQQKAMPQPTDEQAKSMQRIMLFMPPVMGVFLYNYAAGLSLYMITQSLLGILEIKVIKKVWPVDERELPRDPNKGCAPFAKRLAQMAEAQQAQAKALQQQRGRGKGR